METSTVVLICGPQNVGKTTVTRRLAQTFGWAAIELDVLRHFIPDTEVRRAHDFQKELTHRQTLCLLKSYLDHGIGVFIDDQSYDLEYHRRRMKEYRLIANAWSIALISSRSTLTGLRNKYPENDFNIKRLSEVMANYETCIEANAYDEVVLTDEHDIDQMVELLVRKVRTLTSIEPG